MWLHWAKHKICTQTFSEMGSAVSLFLFHHPAARPVIGRWNWGWSCCSCLTLHSQLYTRSKIAHSLETSNVVSLIWGEPSFCIGNKANQADYPLFLLFSFLPPICSSKAVLYEWTENALWLRSWGGKLTCLCTLLCSWCQFQPRIQILPLRSLCLISITECAIVCLYGSLFFRG